jgi:C4-dicarboxylate-specific signal transduction histidine kinase
MSTEEFMREPPKNRSREFVAYVAIAVVMFGAGMLLQSRLAAQTAASVKLSNEQELKQVAERADQENRKLADSLAKEREEHEKDNEEHAKDLQAKDKHLSALTGHAAGVRHALEADLSAARSSGQACTSRIAGISEALGGVFDSIGEVTGIAQDLGRENQQLKEDNKSLSDKLAGWQKWNAERAQRVTVIGEKRG